jgi:hypothetical protein
MLALTWGCRRGKLANSQVERDGLEGPKVLCTDTSTDTYNIGRRKPMSFVAHLSPHTYAYKQMREGTNTQAWLSGGPDEELATAGQELLCSAAAWPWPWTVDRPGSPQYALVCRAIGPEYGHTDSRAGLLVTGWSWAWRKDIGSLGLKMNLSEWAGCDVSTLPCKGLQRTLTSEDTWWYPATPVLIHGVHVKMSMMAPAAAAAFGSEHGIPSARTNAFTSAQPHAPLCGVSTSPCGPAPGHQSPQLME